MIIELMTTDVIHKQDYVPTASKNMSLFDVRLYVPWLSGLYVDTTTK